MLAELRVVQDEYAARVDYDVKAIFRDNWRMQDASGRQNVHYPARRIVAEQGDGATTGH